ncbi:hypothetical protein D9757_012412 [Collybiopsis confluens]|uniref:Uncharacterized protein n=1 Tax=Collybiopsis confluens TaxID=2823264 RepID=A0A8H5H0N7_9AGAR|nr:hypothetical protein D9757_012412 [Collybiopsis confluens]
MKPSLIKRLEREKREITSQKRDVEAELQQCCAALRDLSNRACTNRVQIPSGIDSLAFVLHLLTSLLASHLRPLVLVEKLEGNAIHFPQVRANQERLYHASTTPGPIERPNQAEPAKPSGQSRTVDPNREALKIEMEHWLQQWLNEETGRRRFFEQYPKKKNIPRYDQDKAVLFFCGLRDEMAQQSWTTEYSGVVSVIESVLPRSHGWFQKAKERYKELSKKEI